MFTLCIPTMDRYDSFLKEYLPKYINNDYISEIIICDENGNDIQKIKNNFPGNKKLKLHTNSQKLGPFLNKMKCCKFSSNKWIALIDSDNFADTDYFEKAKNYIDNKNVDNNVILAPCWAKPRFNYSYLNNKILNKSTLKSFNIDKAPNNYTPISVLMNTGNYIINKYLIDNININNDVELINNSSACDVILFNTLLFEQLDLNIVVVADMTYSHVVHDGSTYIQNCNQTTNYIKVVHDRFNKLIKL